jgi:hypothetical protein
MLIHLIIDVFKLIFRQKIEEEKINDNKKHPASENRDVFSYNLEGIVVEGKDS